MGFELFAPTKDVTTDFRSPDSVGGSSTADDGEDGEEDEGYSDVEGAIESGSDNCKSTVSDE
eukprot:9468420-Prorocentrum_lima.AAC.1